MSNNFIINEESLVFDFPEEDFYIEFNNGVWRAIHNDENKFDNSIILEDLKSGIKFEEDMVIFDTNYILTQVHFDKLKNFN